MSKLADVCLVHSKRIAEAVHSRIRAVVEKRNVALMREIVFVCGIKDPNRFADYVFSLPMLGWARGSPLLCQRLTPPPRSERLSPERIAIGNAEALRKTRLSKDPKVDANAWPKTSD